MARQGDGGKPMVGAVPGAEETRCPFLYSCHSRGCVNKAFTRCPDGCCSMACAFDSGQSFSVTGGQGEMAPCSRKILGMDVQAWLWESPVGHPLSATMRAAKERLGMRRCGCICAGIGAARRWRYLLHLAADLSTERGAKGRKLFATAKGRGKVWSLMLPPPAGPPQLGDPQRLELVSDATAPFPEETGAERGRGLCSCFTWQCTVPCRLLCPTMRREACQSPVQAPLLGALDMGCWIPNCQAGDIRARCTTGSQREHFTNP